MSVGSSKRDRRPDERGLERRRAVRRCRRADSPTRRRADPSRRRPECRRADAPDAPRSCTVVCRPAPSDAERHVAARRRIRRARSARNRTRSPVASSDGSSRADVEDRAAAFVRSDSTRPATPADRRRSAVRRCRPCPRAPPCAATTRRGVAMLRSSPPRYAKPGMKPDHVDEVVAAGVNAHDVVRAQSVLRARRPRGRGRGRRHSTRESRRRAPAAALRRATSASSALERRDERVVRRRGSLAVDERRIVVHRDARERRHQIDDAARRRRVERARDRAHAPVRRFVDRVAKRDHHRAGRRAERSASAPDDRTSRCRVRTHRRRRRARPTKLLSRCVVEHPLLRFHVQDVERALRAARRACTGGRSP